MGMHWITVKEGNIKVMATCTGLIGESQSFSKYLVRNMIDERCVPLTFKYAALKVALIMHTRNDCMNVSWPRNRWQALLFSVGNGSPSFCC